MNVLFLVPPIGDRKLPVQTDAVLARCPGIFLKSSYFLTPIGLAYLAGAVREWTDSRVDFLDCRVAGYSIPEAISRIRELGPDLIIFTLGTPALEFSARFFGRLKDEIPGLRITAVGTQVTVLPQESLEALPIDFVVRGEPEETASELIVLLERGDDPARIKGLSYRSGDQIIHNPDRPLREDIDSLPLPARDLLPQEKYSAPFARRTPFGLILTARGCPYSCKFCTTRAYYGHTWRPRKVESIVAELGLMAERYGIRDIGFWDDTFTIQPERVIAICREIIKEELDIEWICLSRVDTVSRDMLAWMKKAGCYQIQFGVESGDEDILRRLGKPVTIRQVRQAFQWCVEEGIEPVAFFMLGNPGETGESLEKTISLSLELPARYASFNIYTPYPGCELFYELRERLPADWSRFDAGHTIIENDIDGDLEEYIQTAYRRFYRRPGYLFRSLLKVRSFSD
ncbi:MAG: radical SAM protein, partial [Candidatus Auribacterota bacterium]|nr:radical SAM protein [Candidatus Auribacterota bacterium]